MKLRGRGIKEGAEKREEKEKKGEKRRGGGREKRRGGTHLMHGVLKHKVAIIVGSCFLHIL